MAKKKPKPNLKKIKEHARLFGNLSGMNKMQPGYPQLNPYLAYLQEEEGISKEEAQLQRNMLLQDTSQIGGYILEDLVTQQNGLIKEVEKDPRDVLSKLKQQSLVQMAMPHIGDDIYKAKVAILESGKPSTIGGVVMGLYKSKSWQRAVSNASSTTLKDTLEKEITRDQETYMVADLGLNVETQKIDRKKTATFLAPKITTNEEKLNIGLSYANKE